jgi:hypothetical protein
MTGYALTTGRTFKLMAINPGSRIGCEHTLGSDCRTPRRGGASGSAAVTPDASSWLPSPRLRGAELMEKRVATAAPARSLLQRRQLLRLTEQTASAALLGAPSLVVGHDLQAISRHRSASKAAHGSNSDVHTSENAGERKQIEPPWFE